MKLQNPDTCFEQVTSRRHYDKTFCDGISKSRFFITVKNDIPTPGQPARDNS
jgi:hypothetical protein